MTTDNFTEAARAETPEPCTHHWVSHGQDSTLIPWVIRCDLCGAFHIAEMERAARAPLTAQEPTDAEIEAAARAIWATRYPESRPDIAESTWADMTAPDDWTPEALDIMEEARAALSSRRAARRDEETP